MDDFLSKPIRGASLEAVLERWTSDRIESTNGMDDETAPRPLAGVVGAAEPDRDQFDGPRLPCSAPIDLAVTLDPEALRPIWDLEAVSKPGLFDEMVDLFRDEGTTRIAEVRAAVAQGDADLVYRLAHTMKGEALAWGASALVEVSRRLEDRSGKGNRAELERLLSDLEQLFDATLIALHAARPTPA